MKTKLIAIAALVLLAAACSSESEVINPDELVPVKVHVNEFSISMSGFNDGPAKTRADDAASYAGVDVLQLAIYDADGKAVVDVKRIKGDGSYTSFGDFTCQLPVGNYTMVALGYAHYDGDVFTLTSPTEAAYTSERPRETFSKVQSVQVTNSDAVDIDVTLDRISAKLEIKSTDNRPAGIDKIRTTFAKGGKSFNPSTGLALTDGGFTQTNSPSAAVGSTINVGSMPLLYTDEETMDITIEVLDAGDNVLFTKVVPNVPFKRNNITTVSGPIFTAGSSAFGFKLNTTWGPGYNVTF
ncbi:FimB/Mfa2 family fimbrial subunit [Xylanibacter ruminicola]|uniref:FimB/Mfa2 family fimbrial subunit n=1 Tax=Xylanibacter ruminicola TaxID=839 RepID=UPI00048D1533|nr:FimB/Mfa2 family fimbrial subunit [Xylanibacter ruminicola]